MSRVITNLLHITYLHISSHHIYMLLTIFGGPFIDLSPSYKRVVEVNHPEESPPYVYHCAVNAGAICAWSMSQRVSDCSTLNIGPYDRQRV